MWWVAQGCSTWAGLYGKRQDQRHQNILQACILRQNLAQERHTAHQIDSLFIPKHTDNTMGASCHRLRAYVLTFV